MSQREYNFPVKLAPSGVVDVDLISAHSHSSNHRAELLLSPGCGCFDCLATFSAESIEHWTDVVDGVGVTALCPKCGSDCVVGSASGYSIEQSFLQRMHEYRCGSAEEALPATGSAGAGGE